MIVVLLILAAVAMLALTAFCAGAETAFLSDYQELWDATKAGTAFPDQMKEASGGVYVRYIGNRASNDLVWKDVKVDAAGELVLAFKMGARFEVTFLELLSRVSQALDGLDEVARKEVAENRR